jgi:hypothetical protein
MYKKWVGMVDRVHGHVDPDEIEKSVRALRTDDTGTDDETVDIPDVPLTLTKEDLQ